MSRDTPKTAGTGAASSADYRLLTAHMAETGLAWLNRLLASGDRIVEGRGRVSLVPPRSRAPPAQSGHDMQASGPAMSSLTGTSQGRTAMATP